MNVKPAAPLKMKIVAAKYQLKDQPSDLAYWLTRPIEERMETLEEIRQEYHDWKGDTPARLQRVYRIVKLK